MVAESVVHPHGGSWAIELYLLGAMPETLPTWIESMGTVWLFTRVYVHVFGFLSVGVDIDVQSCRLKLGLRGVSVLAVPPFIFCLPFSSRS